MAGDDWRDDERLSDWQRELIEEERRRQREKGEAPGGGPPPPEYGGADPDYGADPGYGRGAGPQRPPPEEPPPPPPRRGGGGGRGGFMSGCGCCSGLGCLVPALLLVVLGLLLFFLPLDTVFGSDNVCGSATAVECLQDTYETVTELRETVDSLNDSIGDVFGG